MLEAETVITVEPYVGTYPKKSPGILVHYIDAVVGKAVVDGQATELCPLHGGAEKQECYGDKA